MESQLEAPGALKKRGQLYPDLRPIWDAFWFLNSSRATGMSVGAIPLNEMVTYWRDMVGVKSRTELFDNIKLLQKMDATYLEIKREN